MQDQYKYHLKDKEKEKLLSQLCENQNAFLEALQPHAEKLHKRERDIVYVAFGDLSSIKEYSVRLTCSDIIEINQYNPKVWNNFLNTVPPEYETLRLEINHYFKRDYCVEHSAARYCAFYDGRQFIIAHSERPITFNSQELANGDIEVRFKAWDD